MDILQIYSIQYVLHVLYGAETVLVIIYATIALMLIVIKIVN